MSESISRFRVACWSSSTYVQMYNNCCEQHMYSHGQGQHCTCAHRHALVACIVTWTLECRASPLRSPQCRSFHECERSCRGTCHKSMILTGCKACCSSSSFGLCRLQIAAISSTRSPACGLWPCNSPRRASKHAIKCNAHIQSNTVDSAIVLRLHAPM